MSSAFKLSVWSWGPNPLSIVKGSWAPQLPLSISFVSPSCPEQLWQRLCLCIDSCSAQTGLCFAASCHCIWVGRICPGLICLLCLVQIRRSSQSLEVSGAVRGSQSRVCCAMLCNTMSSWWPEQGGKGCSLLGCRERCWGKREVQALGGNTGLPPHRHVGYPNTSACWQAIHCVLLPSALPWQTLPCDLWGSRRFDREGWASALPWMAGHTHQRFSLPLIREEEWHLLLLG